MTRKTNAGVAVAIGLILWACGDAAGPVPSTLVLSPDSVRVPAGGEQHITATVYDASGTVIPDAIVAYRSTDTTVARVTTGGHVAVGGHVSARAAGRALVVGTSGTAADTVIIDVMP
ncbi:MAG: hypothetical protein WD934_07685 [Gemmatimonadales bacterium]